VIDEQHIIEKVKVDVEVENVELAENIKSEISDFVQKEVLTIIESYFTDLNVPEELRNKVIQLDRVDLSLETASWNPHSVGMKQVIRDEVEKQMNPIIADLRETMIKDKLSISPGFDAIREGQMSVYSKEERIVKSVFYFLEHGTLPWWVNSVDESRELFSEKSLMTALRGQPDFAQKQFAKLRRNEQVKTRLVRQFSISVVSEFIQLGLSLKTSQRSKVTSFILREFQQVPHQLVGRILHLILDLSEGKVLTEALRKDANEKLFRHVHEKFFQSDLGEGVLVSTIKTTYALHRILHVLARQSTQLETVKTEFREMLKTELLSNSYASLKETKVFQQLFESTTDPSELNVEGFDQKKQSPDEILHSQKRAKDGNSENKLKDATNPDNTNKTENVSVEANNDKLKTSDENESRLKESTSNETSEEAIENTNLSNVKDEIRDKSTSAQDSGKNKEESEDSENQSLKRLKSSAKTPHEQQAEQDIVETESDNVSVDTDKKSGRSSDVAEAGLDFTSKQERMADNERDSLSEILRKEKDTELRKKRNTEEMPNELFFSNAGLVLLNPFVPALFKKLELLDNDGKLTNPEVAAILLHYAATGREGDYEFEMAFEKYVCGIPPSIPINREIAITQEQKDEVGVVLNSVLQHWTALKSKSPELLRNEFLSRSGKLIVEKSNHRLIIERKTFDLLLDKLPWSYSLLKFSWKKELIFVEW